MDAELDVLVIKMHLERRAESLLNILQAKVNNREKRIELWMENFLTIFILITSAELFFKHAERNARKYGHQVRVSVVLLNVYDLC